MSLYIDMKWKNEYVFFLLSFILAVILIQHSSSMDLFEYILTLFVLSIILMFVYYIFTHTKESYENTRGGTVFKNVVPRDHEESNKPNPSPNQSFYRHAVWNFLANLPRYIGEFKKVGNDGHTDDDSVTIDFHHAQKNHPTYYKLGVFDSLQDKSEKYFNDERFGEILSKIKHMNAGLVWLHRHKCCIYNRLREKFSS